MMHDAEKLERALESRRTLGEAAAQGLSPELREALAAAEGLEQLRVPLGGGPRPSFVQALEDQLRADLRTGVGRPAAREASPWTGRSVLAGILLLALGLLLGRIGFGGPGVKTSSDLPSEVPGLLSDRAPERDAARGLPADALASDASGPSRLPWLVLSPAPAESLAGDPTGQSPTTLSAAPSGPQGIPAPARAAEARDPAAAAAPATEAAQPLAAAAMPQEPVSAAPVEEPEEGPEEPAAAPALPTEGPPPTPERTPDADPEP